MRTVIERDDAGVVNHLVPDGHVTRPLHDLRRVVVDGREDHVREAARDAAIVEAHVFVAVERPDRIGVGAHTALRTAQPLLPFRRQRRDLTVGRIGDEPHAAVATLERVED